MEGFWEGGEGQRLQLETEVEKAMLELDRKERRAYETALEVFPELVRRETKIMDFLRTENFNVKKAAVRLALYWKYRKKMFKERWLLPLTQTGTGALTMDEVEMMRSGYSKVVQRAPEGGLVILYDQSLWKNFDSAQHARNIMYVTTVFTDEVTQREGMTVVYIVRSGEGAAKPDVDPEGWQMFHAAIPMKLKQLLVAQAYEEGKEGLLDYLCYQTSRTAEFRSRKKPNLLISDSLRGTLALLESKGVKRQHLPRTLGGVIDDDWFANWVRRRISIEDIMSPTPIKCNKLTPVMLIEGPWASFQGGSHAGHTTTTAMIVPNKKAAKKSASKKKKAPVSKAPNDEDARKLNALYARRSYHKRKLEMLGLEEQTEALRAHNRRLRKENQDLESAVVMAQRIVFSHQQDMTMAVDSLQSNMQAFQFMGINGDDNIQNVTLPGNGWFTGT